MPKTPFVRFRVAFLVLLILLLGATVVHATPLVVTNDGIVTQDNATAVGMAAPLSVELFLDPLILDEDLSLDVYLASSNPGTLPSFVLIDMTGTIFSVDSSEAGGE